MYELPLFFSAADDVIKETIDALNADFPGDGPPDGNSPVPRVTGGPIYDETPARVTVGVADCSGGGTTAPIFDSTPLPHGSADDITNDLPNLSISEHTPQWQDTPSQSVCGPEEVTQEHNVQAQLDKYEKEHGARVAEHEKKVQTYQRRRVAVAKRKLVRTPGVQPYVASVPRRSPRVAVSTSVPRRSPRVAASAT